MEQKIIAQVESNRDSMIEDILKVVRIDSVESEALPGKPFGEGVAAALDMALSIADTLGISMATWDMHNMVKGKTM